MSMLISTNISTHNIQFKKIENKKEYTYYRTATLQSVASYYHNKDMIRRKIYFNVIPESMYVLKVKSSRRFLNYKNHNR